MSRLPDIANPQRKPYPSDLSDTEWEVLSSPAACGKRLRTSRRGGFTGDS
ncbi:MAG TPA: hypothetical protein V6D11_14705 [Waterburya sp.]